ncbi:MAG: hypothetical protein IPN22_09630 [Bacteroidetes bacterium]|nr:hypothetical protein [Bacteroidota bacterium]
MAREVPVISSNAGGIPEINVHGTTSYERCVGDFKDMAQNTITLLEDEARLATVTGTACLTRPNLCHRKYIAAL